MTLFVGGDTGRWLVVSMSVVRGNALPFAPRLSIIEDESSVGDTGASTDARWTLRGVRSYVRYVERREKSLLDRLSPPLGRREATRAALIPIRKSAAWWDLPQDERRAIFEERSRHIADSMKYLPAIARRLHHSRDLGEPFDFLTWFEFAPEHAGVFEELVGMLRGTEEWRFVEREVDVRVAAA